MNAQEMIAANVAARGYRDGWTAEQFVARQLCKLTEELNEAAKESIVGLPLSRNVLWWLDKLDDAGRRARIAFDTQEDWSGAELVDSDILRSELADMQVVLFAAAAALDFDIVQTAIDKSAVDVPRGVR